MRISHLAARSRASATPQFAIDERYRFASGSAASLGARMDALLDDAATLAADRAAALALASKYRFEASYERLVGVYEDVLRDRGRVA